LGNTSKYFCIDNVMGHVELGLGPVQHFHEQSGYPIRCF